MPKPCTVSLRGLFLVPAVGAGAAALIGWPVAVIIVMAIAILFAPWVGLQDRRRLLGLGIIWMVLTFFFEVGVGYARGLSNEAILAEINPFSGGLMVYSLAVMLLAPLVAARLRAC